MKSLHTSMKKSPPLSITRENPVHGNKDPAQQKKKKKVPVKRIVCEHTHTQALGGGRLWGDAR